MTLLGLRAEHPDAAHVEQILKALGQDLAVTRGSKPALIAHVRFAERPGRTQKPSEFAAPRPSTRDRSTYDRVVRFMTGPLPSPRDSRSGVDRNGV